GVGGEGGWGGRRRGGGWGVGGAPGWGGSAVRAGWQNRLNSASSGSGSGGRLRRPASGSGFRTSGSGSSRRDNQATLFCWGRLLAAFLSRRQPEALLEQTAREDAVFGRGVRQ